MSETREHNLWMAMNDRCYCKGSTPYQKYGAVGITVCDKWRYSFENFFADMGVCPPGLTLDRRDGRKGYSPDNCRWATVKQQANNRRSNIRVTWNGVTKNVSEWSAVVGIDASLLNWRIKNDWPVDMAMTHKPAMGNNRRPKA
jgi:regulation of enolase protein 1 (concanavalin A-like superfamily)